MVILTNNWTDCRVLYNSDSSSCPSSFLDFISVSLSPFKKKRWWWCDVGKRLDVWQKEIHLFGVIFAGLWGVGLGFLLSLVGGFALFGDNLGSISLIFQV